MQEGSENREQKREGKKMVRRLFAKRLESIWTKVTLTLTGYCLCATVPTSSGAVATHRRHAHHPATPTGEAGRSVMLFDFRSLDSLADWREVSDTKREVGMSKAALILQKTQLFQRAIFFTLLNPQPNGAGFAGMVTTADLDLTGYTGLRLRARAQGAARHYKVVLKDNHDQREGNFEHQFEMDPASTEFQSITLALEDFEFMYRGRPQPAHDPLNAGEITEVGLQTFGGVYSDFKQAGSSTLEIDFIEAVVV